MGAVTHAHPSLGMTTTHYWHFHITQPSRLCYSDQTISESESLQKPATLLARCCYSWTFSMNLQANTDLRSQDFSLNFYNVDVTYIFNICSKWGIWINGSIFHTILFCSFVVPMHSGATSLSLWTSITTQEDSLLEHWRNKKIYIYQSCQWHSWLLLKQKLWPLLLYQGNR